jgi:plastocyanin
MHKQRLLIILSVLILLPVGAGVLLAVRPHLANQSQPNKSGNERPENSGQTEEEQRDYKQEVTVTVSADGISPQTLNISKDTRINWMNTDTAPHKLVITSGTAMPPQFDNNHQIDPAGGYPYVVHQPVTFYYFVADQPSHSGTVIVK